MLACRDAPFSHYNRCQEIGSFKTRSCSCTRTAVRTIYVVYNTIQLLYRKYQKIVDYDLCPPSLMTSNVGTAQVCSYLYKLSDTQLEAGGLAMALKATIKIPYEINIQQNSLYCTATHHTW